MEVSYAFPLIHSHSHGIGVQKRHIALLGVLDAPETTYLEPRFCMGDSRHSMHIRQSEDLRRPYKDLAHCMKLMGWG